MFLTELLTGGVLCALLALAATHWGLFNGGAFGPVFALLFLYALATISFLYFAAHFFSSSQSAAQVMSMAIVVSVLCFCLGEMEEFSEGVQQLLSLFPPLALQYGILSFFPSNAELGLEVCRDSCPKGFTACSHALGFDESVCLSKHVNGKRRFRDFCDFDDDCCGNALCSDPARYAHEAGRECIISLHKVNCVSQEEFDMTSLPLTTVAGLLVVDALLFALLAAAAHHFKWACGDSCGLGGTLGAVAAAMQQSVGGGVGGATSQAYARVSTCEDDDEEEDGGDGGDENAAATDDNDDEAEAEAGNKAGSSLHPEGYIEERLRSGQEGQRASVKVVGLVKAFGGDAAGGRGGGGGRREVRALDRTCLELREGQLTVLMGQNGAGKTTLINVLTGRIGGDDGRAEVYGHDVLSSGGMGRVRQSLGVCPQEDALFDGFTPTEMLSFYAALKGVEEEDQPAAVQSMLQQMGLLDSGGGGSYVGSAADSAIGSAVGSAVGTAGKWLSGTRRKPAQMLVHELSGGQRRRVSIGIALIGDSRLVVLDEPTSAMDPLGKHQTWTLLRRLRAGRTILLTTHLMDEADAVADQVAIMAGGRVHCAGSPAFLKRRLGKGYTLTLARLTTQLSAAEASSSSSSSSSAAAAAAAGAKDGELEAVAAWVKARLASSVAAAASSSSSSSSRGVSMRRSRGQVHVTLPFSVSLAAFFRDLDSHLAEKRQTESLSSLPSSSSSSPPSASRAALSYGVEMPSLESVFLAVTSRALGLPNPEDDDEPAAFDEPAAAGPALPRHAHGLSARAADAKNCEPPLKPRHTRSSWTTVRRQASAVLAFRLHLSCVGAPVATLSLLAPSLVSNVAAAAVLGGMHSLSGDARCGVITAMALVGIFLPGVAAATLIKEREGGLRHLLAVSGCGLRAFWVGTVGADAAAALLPTLALWAAAHAFRVEGWAFEPLFYAATLAFAAHAAVFSGALSFCFPNSASASLFGPGLVLVVNVLCPALAVLGLNYVLPSGLRQHLPWHLGGTLAWAIACCSPHVLLAVALAALAVPEAKTDPPLNCGAALLLQGCQAALLFALCLRMESSYTRPVTTPGRNLSGDDVEAEAEAGDEDGDVVRERARAVGSGADPNVLLRLVNLRKEYPKEADAEPRDPTASSSLSSLSSSSTTTSSSSSVRVAVRSVSVVARCGECVGLLGPNGAGKSTTIGMLSRATVPTEGDASVCGHSVLSDAPAAFEHLGLVPQDMDTLWPTATVNAHMALFKRLRCVPSSSFFSSSSSSSSSLDLEEDASEDASVLAAVRLSSPADRAKRAGALSGGMRRRLSTALALVGRPRVVVLDEPTAGLDPLSRRHVWDALRRTVARDRIALLLTTHSLDEAEALCHRLGIVVDGSLRCIGTPLHLKTKFGRGYELSLRLADDSDDEEEEEEEEEDGGSGCGGGGARGSRVSAAISALVAQFPSASVLEAHDNRFRLLVPRADMDLPRALELLDRLASADRTSNRGAGGGVGKPSASSAFYCVNLASIEQVFLDVVQG